MIKVFKCKHCKKEFDIYKIAKEHERLCSNDKKLAELLSLKFTNIDINDLQASLQEIRLTKGLLIKELAKIVGNNVAYISEVERSKKPISVEKINEILQKIGLKLKISIEIDSNAITNNNP